MLTLKIEKREMFDDNTGTFLGINETAILYLEHNLLSVKEWESRWKKPFLKDEDKTIPEIVDYIRCMTLNKDVDQNVYLVLRPKEIEKVVDYIKDPMTATTFSDNALKGAQTHRREMITSEIIYYWMVALKIPVEFQSWHLNQLLTLIKVINIKNDGGKKLSKQEAARQRKELNAKRKAKYHTKG